MTTGESVANESVRVKLAFRKRKRRKTKGGPMNRKRIRRDLRVLDAVQDAFKRYSKAHYYVDKVLEPAYDMPNTVVNDAAFGAALPFIRSLAQTFSILDRLVTARVEHGGAARARRKAKAERLTGGLPAVEVVT